MPKRGASGTKGLIKHHHCAERPKRLTQCKCQWSGKYGKYDIVLSRWAGCSIDPHTKGKAVEVLTRFIAAVDARRFDPAGEVAPAGTTETLRTFITEWQTHYAEERGLTANSLSDMLNVLAEGKLGGRSLEHLAGASQEIERWLNATGKARKWKAKTWNGYYDLLNRVLKRATKWKVGGKPRLAVNPMADIERKVATQPEHFKQRHLVEDVEDRLFAVVDQLNRPGRKKPGRLATNGTEMRRRLIAAFDGGLRAGEMLSLQVAHVDLHARTLADGTSAYVITLPAAITKGGKSTGEPECVYAATARFRHVLEARCFALKNNPPHRQYLFGREDGGRQDSFDKLWRRLFKAAGLEYGRDHGLVWHTIRHEHISRVAEQTKDPVLTQELARHRELETTQGYFHARQDRVLAAAAGLERKP